MMYFLSLISSFLAKIWWRLHLRDWLMRHIRALLPALFPADKAADKAPGVTMPPAAASRASPARKTLSLALQGGGSHGAFTWGVLDALLEEEDLDIDGISGASAGALNAVLLAQGFAQAASAGGPAARQQQRGREAARRVLSRFWTSVGALSALNPVQRAPLEVLFGSSSPAQMPHTLWLEALSNLVSPYQTNPLDINPLRTLLQRHVDFAAVAALQQPKIFVCATRVRDGQAEVFSGERLDVQAVMASACLPQMFRAVAIGGEHYWDGGYSGNPALTPLLAQCRAQDLLLVQIITPQRDQVPESARAIFERIDEITFNTALTHEIRHIHFVNQLLRAGRLEGTGAREIRLHRIEGDLHERYGAATRAATDAALIDGLFKLGRERTQNWLVQHRVDIGLRATLKPTLPISNQPYQP